MKTGWHGCKLIGRSYNLQFKRRGGDIIVELAKQSNYNQKSKSKHNNNKNKRIAVRKKIIYRKSNLSHTLDMQSIPSHNGIPGKFLEKFRLLEISLMMNP